jgi:sugar phosphate isomerase/epimerase
MQGLSCNSGLLSQFTVEQAMDVLAEQGYQAIDISLEVAPPFLPAPKPHMSPDADSETRRRVRRHADNTGVAIAAVNAHTSLIRGLPEARQASLQFIMRSLQLAADLGAPYVITGGGMKDIYGKESQFWEWLVDGLRELVIDAGRLGVTLAIEAGSFPGSLVHNLSRMQKLLSYEGLETLRVLFDPSHYHIRGDSAVLAYRALSSRVVHVHAKDACGQSPEDFEFPPLGMGEIEFPALLAAMTSAHYAGYISVEYEAFAWGYTSDPRQVLRESKAFLDRLMAPERKN